jgi:predicted metalloprotease
MRWTRGGSGGVEDRRAMPGGRAALPVGGGLVGVVVTVLILLLGGGGYASTSPFEQFPAQPATGGSTMDTRPTPTPSSIDFSSFVVRDLQKFWAADFQKAGRAVHADAARRVPAEPPTGCGTAPPAPGRSTARRPQIYLDLGFFRELAQRFQAPGDFAQAYVIAHEYGHHVQTLTGITEQVDDATRENPDQRNALSVRTELQADCLAGVWGALDVRARACSSRATSRRG